MPRDLHHNIKPVRCISPVAVGTTGTGKTGKPVDRSGFESVEIIIDYGTITATNATITPTIFEGDVTGTMTSVADSNMLTGAEAAAAVGATGSRVSGVSKNVTKKIPYFGTKKYVNAKVVSTITAGPPIAATVILGAPHERPTASGGI